MRVFKNYNFTIKNSLKLARILGRNQFKNKFSSWRKIVIRYSKMHIELCERSKILILPQKILKMGTNIRSKARLKIILPSWRKIVINYSKIRIKMSEWSKVLILRSKRMLERKPVFKDNFSFVPKIENKCLKIHIANIRIHF